MVRKKKIAAGKVKENMLRSSTSQSRLNSGCTTTRNAHSSARVGLKKHGIKLSKNSVGGGSGANGAYWTGPAGAATTTDSGKRKSSSGRKEGGLISI